MAEVIAALTALPAYLLFHLTWLIHSLRRPLLLVSLLCLLNPTAAIKKCHLFYMTFMYLAFCQDKKFKIPKDDPAAYFPVEFGGTAASNDSSNVVKSKKVILIRHGESTWNYTFNPG